MELDWDYPYTSQQEDQMTIKFLQTKQLGLQFLDFLIQAFWEISSKNLQLQQK